MKDTEVCKGMTHAAAANGINGNMVGHVLLVMDYHTAPTFNHKASVDIRV